MSSPGWALWPGVCAELFLRLVISVSRPQVGRRGLSDSGLLNTYSKSVVILNLIQRALGFLGVLFFRCFFFHIFSPLSQQKDAASLAFFAPAALLGRQKSSALSGNSLRAASRRPGTSIPLRSLSKSFVLRASTSLFSSKGAATRADRGAHLPEPPKPLISGLHLFSSQAKTE